MSCKTLFDESGATQEDLAAALNLHQSTVSRILNGLVELKQRHIDVLLPFFSKRLKRKVKYEELTERSKGRAA